MDINYFKETFHFSPDNNVPLYMQLASYMKIQIQAGVLKPGDLMIAENQLCAILNISRTTVRQCMNHLVEEGLIVRYRGKGSYIADQKIKRPINYLYNFTENLKSIGTEPKSIVLTKEVTDTIPDTVLEQLKLPPMQTKAFHLTRLRCADNQPIMLEDTYIPYYLCPDIEQFNFGTTSLYDTLSHTYSLNLYHAYETIEAIIVKKKEADLLGCSAGSPAYKIKRTSHLDSGYVYEYTTSITRGDRCLFQLDLYKNANKNSIDFKRHLSID